MEQNDDVTTLTQQIETSSPQGFVFGRLVGNDLKEHLPSVMNELIRTAERY